VIEKFVDGLQITGLGMGIVFFSLYLLSTVLYFFKILFYKPKKKTDIEDIEREKAVLIVSTILEYFLKDKEYKIIRIREVT